MLIFSFSHLQDDVHPAGFLFRQPDTTNIVLWAGWWEGLRGIWALLDHIFPPFSPPILAEVPFQRARKAAVHTLPYTGFAMLLGCLGRDTFSGRCCPGVNTHPLASAWGKVRKTQSLCLKWKAGLHCPVCPREDIHHRLGHHPSSIV